MAYNTSEKEDVSKTFNRETGKLNMLYPDAAK